jgi:5-enolpyruvylshikimate-3-phosphate synthase
VSGRATSWLTPSTSTPVRARVVAPEGSSGRVDPAVAAGFGAAGLITAGTVLIRNWPREGGLGDVICDVFAEMEGYVVASDDGLTVTSRSTSGVLGPVDEVARNVATLLPLIVVLATRATGVSRLSGVDEDDVAGLIGNVRRLGGAADLVGEELTIEPRRLAAGVWEAEGSVPSAIAGAVLGLVTPGVQVVGWNRAEDTYRGLTAEWLRMISADEYLVPGSAKLPHEYMR